ncbi:hypothetical protein CEP52_017612 [Fusarium oligoseptatum]|uniref:Uncharacterized protein n=1 Tax=Fusarium oligoseptatum TaxID=2604345 RepID=A0A428RMB2_9HYPO|nr:hypothetical protein CEP52_017612 [Fusarium oligoseptatum]
MTCLESFSIPMKALHTPDRTRARRLPVLIDMEPLDIRREDIGGHLMEYSKRDLSHQSDALKAFLGILSYFKTKNSWHHFLGNPIHAKESHLINAWYHPEPATRRPEFPSWSWTGWKGALKLTSRDNPDYKLQLETKTGKLVSVHEYIELCDKSQTPDMERFVQLTGKMINVQFERIHRTSDTQIARNSSHDGLTLKNGFWAILPFTNDVVSYSFLYRDDEALKEETGFTLPAMVLETGIHSQNHITVVLVLRKKNNDYERVGLLRMGNATKPEAGDKSWISDVETVVYKDASGHWSKHAPICKLERRVWLKAAEEETIRLR